MSATALVWTVVAVVIVGFGLLLLWIFIDERMCESRRRRKVADQSIDLFMQSVQRQSAANQRAFDAEANMRRTAREWGGR